MWFSAAHMMPVLAGGKKKKFSYEDIRFIPVRPPVHPSYSHYNDGEGSRSTRVKSIPTSSPWSTVGPIFHPAPNLDIVANWTLTSLDYLSC